MRNKLLLGFFLWIFVLPLVTKAQESYKGFWFRYENRLGAGVSSVPSDLKILKGKQSLTWGEGISAGYHFNNRWSAGLGINTQYFLDPDEFSNATIFLEGTARPFRGKIAPLALNARVGCPLVVSTDYEKGDYDLSFSVSWAFRRKVCKTIGADVSVGVGYIPFEYEVVENIPNTLTAKSIVHSLHQVYPFIGVALLIN